MWQRSAKRIELPEQARAALGIDDAVLAPTEVIRAILRAPVDVLWNGGIGTVVKASTETDAEALDRSSDAIRVDATELRCRVVAEGGNLGLTQRARIEFARDGGLDQRRLHRQLGRRRLLRPRGQPQGPARPRGAPRRARRRRARRAAGRGHRRRRRARPLRLLPAGPDARPGGPRLGDADVRLRGPHGRAGGRGPAAARGRVPAHLRGDGRSPALGPRARAPGAGRAAGLRQAQPHRRAAASPRCPTIRYLEGDLRGYFPPAVVERLGHLLGEHPLRRELVATIVSNHVVNALGPTFVSRLVAEQGAEPADVVRAYRIARDVTGAEAALGRDRAPRPASTARRSGRSWRASTSSSRRRRAGTWRTPAVPTWARRSPPGARASDA